MMKQVATVSSVARVVQSYLPGGVHVLLSLVHGYLGSRESAPKEHIDSAVISGVILLTTSQIIF